MTSGSTPQLTCRLPLPGAGGRAAARTYPAVPRPGARIVEVFPEQVSVANICCWHKPDLTAPPGFARISSSFLAAESPHR